MTDPKKLADMTPEERGDRVRKWGDARHPETGHYFVDEFLASLRRADREAERRSGQVRLSMADERIHQLQDELRLASTEPCPTCWGENSAKKLDMTPEERGDWLMDTNHTDDDAFLDKIAALRDADRQAGRDEIWDEIQDATEIAGSEAYHRLRHRFQTEPCPTCGGSGYKDFDGETAVDADCEACDGTGRVPTWKAVALRIADALTALNADGGCPPEWGRAAEWLASRDWSGKGDDE